MYKYRAITEKLEQLVGYFPAVVITGARQVGKSTLVKHVLGTKADYVQFDPVLDVENARSEPELFLDHHPPPLILDEIQYAPQLVSVLKRRIDEDRTPGQYILTGSQQWAKMKAIAESLAGRAVFFDLHGFSLQEMAQTQSPSWLSQWLETPGPTFLPKIERLGLEHSLYETLWRGSLPEATLMPLNLIQDFYAAYLRTYIERDARQFADISDWQLFGRFVRLVCALTAQEINYSQMGRELGLNPQTARRWLDILRGTFQWTDIPAYSGNVIKRISNKSKGYISDTGLACFAQAISSPNAVSSHPLWGSLFETAVVNELRKQMVCLTPAPNMYHWRTQRGAEVDILLERDGIFYPIEVKATSSPARRDLSGIQALRKTYDNIRIAPGLVIAPMSKGLMLSEQDVAIPWDIHLR
jgi:predicted AAA+ superfamily ATPase